MSDGSLSQDEIDALLQGGGGMDFGAPPAAAHAAPSLSPKDVQSFASLLAGFTGSQGSNLSGMLGKGVTVEAPSAELISRAELMGRLPVDVVEVRIDFSGIAGGEHAYLLSPETATMVAGLMMGQEGVDLNEAALSALEEAGNTMAGSAVTELSDRLGGSVSTTPGETHLVGREDLSLAEDYLVAVTYPMSVEGEAPAEIIELFGASTAAQVVSLLKPAGAGQAAPGSRAAAPRRSAPAGGGFAARPGYAPPASPYAAPPSYGGPQGGSPIMQQASVQPVQFPSLSGVAVPGDQGNIGLLMDVYMEMTVELGRTKKLIRDILGMGEGTIIELDKLAGEPVDILVNHKLIAKGEVVVIDENFGVRVTEIVSPMDRVSDM